MFGEDESESPRVPSPWDSLISTPPSPSPRQSPSPLGRSPSANSLPKLVPEAAEGNIEYKLQLLNPSPARFARLVTQLKWRLLEGGGQAYYELGVADSGSLVGLPRDQLEQSLQTLEMMAGEIGASVIVVKEIEVPAYMQIISKQSQLGDEDKFGEKWLGKGGEGKRDRRRNRRRRLTARAAAFELDTECEEMSTTTTTSLSATELETEFSTDTDSDVDFKPSVVVSAKSTPEPSFTLFPMDPDVEADSDHDNTDPNKGLRLTESVQPVLVDLEIASVYKPRPFRKRVLDPRNMVVPTKRDRAIAPVKNKKVAGTNTTLTLHSLTAHTATTTAIAPYVHATAPVKGAMEGGVRVKDAKAKARAHGRRQARDRRREERRKALLACASASATTTATSPITPDVNGRTDAGTDNDTGIVQPMSRVRVDDFVEALDGLHVLPDTPTIQAATPADTQVLHLVEQESIDDDDDDVINVFVSPPTEPAYSTASTATSNPEPRLIVEALVVRKMSLEEAFLDFGGFDIL